MITKPSSSFVYEPHIMESFCRLLTCLVNLRNPMKLGFVSCYKTTYACRVTKHCDEVHLEISPGISYDTNGSGSVLCMMYCRIIEALDEFMNNTVSVTCTH